MYNVADGYGSYDENKTPITECTPLVSIFLELDRKNTDILFENNRTRYLFFHEQPFGLPSPPPRECPHPLDLPLALSTPLQLPTHTKSQTRIATTSGSASTIVVIASVAFLCCCGYPLASLHLRRKVLTTAIVDFETCSRVDNNYQPVLDVH